MKEYTDYHFEDMNGFVRVFDGEHINTNEMDWHRDKKDRVVTILDSGDDWYFQFDNGLPFKMTPGISIIVKKDMYHRVHKGNDDLVVKIQE